MDRRDFLKYTIMGGAALGLPSFPLALAQGLQTARDVRIHSRVLDVNGKAAKVFGMTGPDGRQGLTFREGDVFDVNLLNTLPDPTMIHWHGLRPPFVQDGVPDAPMPLIKAGEMRHYNFPIGDSGTHWMHAHTLQEQNLLAAPLIVMPKAQADEQDVVMLLHDFSFKPAEELLATLQKGGGHAMDHDMGDMGDMDMAAMDLNDIEYDAYLANDRTLDDPDIVQVEKGGQVRLRIINAATSTVFTIDTGEMEGELIAVDGQDIAPLKGSRFPLAMGQRLDIRLRLPQGALAVPVLALREGSPHRAGIVLAPKGAVIAKLEKLGTVDGPVMDFGLEARLQAVRGLAPRNVDRTINAMLMGGMQPYAWSFTADTAFKVKEGERVAVNIVNHSMMSHPIHLHGHRFQIQNINGHALQGAMRDTVQIPPMGSVTLAFDAVNKGKWAFHCHHLYHMATGMMQMLEYEGV